MDLMFIKMKETKIAKEKDMLFVNLRWFTLFLSAFLFAGGFLLMAKGLDMWKMMHIAGFIGLGWSFVLKKNEYKK